MFDFYDEKPRMKKKDREQEMMRAMLQNKLRLDQEKDDDESSNNSSLIDWDGIDNGGAAGEASRWENYHKVEKYFYHEHENVKNLTFDEVTKWRADNHDIKVAHLLRDSKMPASKKTPKTATSKGVFDEKNNEKDKIQEIPIEKLPKPCTEFIYSFEKYPEIMKTINDQGFKKPSPIQAQFWPCVMQGHDVIGIAQTGTGKTLAFLLPMFLHIEAQKIDHSQRNGPIALILSPTRELALQIESEINKYTYKGIRCICIYGGGDVKKQKRAIETGVEIVVATPGRFNDLCAQGAVKLDFVSYVVMDEADRMLDMGFEPQILKIFLDIRPDRSTLMTSATWPEGVRRLCNTYLNNPIQIVVGSLDLAAVHTVTQYVKIMDETKKEDHLKYYLKKMKPSDKFIIFCGRKATVDQLSSNLCVQGVENDAIHGGRDQECREQALRDFRSGEIKILFATDVASRGIDVDDISVVINYDFPRNMEEYVHRVGRTGRQGRKGRSVTFFTRRDWDYAGELIEILEKTNQKVPEFLPDMARRYKEWRARKDAEREARGETGRFGRNSRIRYRQ